MIKIGDVIQHLERIAPPALQESYDNARLICGNRNDVIKGVIVCLDAIEEVVDEAIAADANLIVSHHPIVFSGLKSITGRNYIERTIIKAIKHDIAIYAIHTNLDNVRSMGVNEKLAQVLGLQNLSILSPKGDIVAYEIRCSDLLKPDVLTEINRQFDDQIERFDLSISANDVGIQVDGPDAVIGRTVHSVCDHFRLNYQRYTVTSSNNHHIGAGILGELALPMTETDFLSHIKDVLKLDVIRHTALLGQSVGKVAICGGSGSFLLGAAMRHEVDFFITADYKYHQFFDADGRLVIADVGHFESEQYTIELLADAIRGKFSTFAARCTGVRTNPVHYFT